VPLVWAEQADEMLEKDALPGPGPPSTTSDSPARISRSMPRSTSFAPKLFLRPMTLIFVAG